MRYDVWRKKLLLKKESGYYVVAGTRYRRDSMEMASRM